MPPHKSKSNSISFVEGQQNGADVAPPLRLLLHGRLRRFILPVYPLSCPEAVIRDYQQSTHCRHSVENKLVSKDVACRPEAVVQETVVSDYHIGCEN